MNVFRKNIKLIIFLGAILLFLIILKLLPVPTKPAPEISVITPTPTSLPASQNTPIPIVTDDPKIREFYKKLDEETYRSYPLFDYIPYKTDDFSLDYIKPLVLEIKLRKDTPEIRQEAYDWILSKGVDPKTHKIIWKTQ